MDDHDWPAKGAFDAAHQIRRITTRLDALAEAFEMTGNSKVANDLYNIARDIDDAAERVSKSLSAQGDRDLREAQAGVAGTLKAILDRA